MSKRGRIVSMDGRAIGLVDHKAVRCVINHNENCVYPPFDKEVEGRGDDNCVALAVLSCCRMLKEVAPMYYGLKWGEQVIEAAKNFHEITLPACAGGVYEPEVGYSMKNVLMFVRHVSQVLLGKGFYALRLASRRDFTHRTFFTMSRGQRAERLFVVFGYYPSSEKNGILQGWLTDWLRSGRTSSRMYDPLPASFWLPKGEFSLHAIAILYDADGNGTIDDPGHPYQKLNINYYIFNIFL